MNVRTIGVIVLAAAGLVGCGIDQDAKRILEQPNQSIILPPPNKFIVATGEDMLKNKRISAARRYTMTDGAVIDVWVINAAKGPAQGTVLTLHGLCDNKISWLPLARMLAAGGYDVVLPDLRAHGQSTGKYVTFGALERQDQKAVMDELYKEKLVSGPLYVIGADLGGTVAITYAAMDERVRGVISIAPMRDLTVAARLVTGARIDDDEFNKLIARTGEIGHFNPADASALSAAARLHCPLLLMHSRLDPLVPYTDSQAIFDVAAGPKELQPLLLPVHFTTPPFLLQGEIVKAVARLASGQIGTAATQPANAPPPGAMPAS
jgi:alpha-beta hydrolase superfamily lysophospholipase